MFDTLKAAIRATIKENHNYEITGPVMQDALISMINGMSTGARFAGMALPTTNPGQPEAPLFYLAYTAGTYTSFGGAVLDGSKLVIFINTSPSSWNVQDTGIAITSSSGTGTLGLGLHMDAGKITLGQNNMTGTVLFKDGVGGATFVYQSLSGDFRQEMSSLNTRLYSPNGIANISAAGIEFYRYSGAGLWWGEDNQNYLINDEDSLSLHSEAQLLLEAVDIQLISTSAMTLQAPYNIDILGNPINLKSSSTISLFTNGIEQVVLSTDFLLKTTQRITVSGNVPGLKIENTGTEASNSASIEMWAKGTNNAGFRTYIGTTFAWEFGADGTSGFSLFNGQASAFSFYVTRANNNLLINTATDNGLDKLQVNGTVNVNGMRWNKLSAAPSMPANPEGQMWFAATALGGFTSVIVRAGSQEYFVPLHQNMPGGTMSIVNMNANGNIAVGGGVRTYGSDYRYAGVALGANRASGVGVSVNWDASTVAPTTPVNGNMWYMANKLYMCQGSAVKSFMMDGDAFTQLKVKAAAYSGGFEVNHISNNRITFSAAGNEWLRKSGGEAGELLINNLGGNVTIGFGLNTFSDKLAVQGSVSARDIFAVSTTDPNDRVKISVESGVLVAYFGATRKEFNFV